MVQGRCFTNEYLRKPPFAALDPMATTAQKAATKPAKILRDARMAAMRKLHRSTGSTSQRQVWVVSEERIFLRLKNPATSTR